MTSATDELRKLLDERGIEHFDYDKGGRTQTMWESINSDDMRHFCYETAANPAKTSRFTVSWFPTPEQAIAATLGGQPARLTAELVNDIVHRHCEFYEGGEVDAQAIADALNAALGCEVNGETSDGYHTFNELYHHRAVLFSVIVRDHRDKAWKARKHHDGTMYDGMFIVGVETPDGQATYHYDLDPYWDMFDCEEREFAPEWDGHTPDEAIARIATLGRGTCRLEETESYQSERGIVHVLECSNCGLECEHVNGSYDHCPHCLARAVER